MDPSHILEITDKTGIAFIDDATQALGASISGRKVGSFGDVGILTFNKSLNVDAGGAMTTNNEEVAAKVRSLREKYEVKSLFSSIAYHVIGYNRLHSRRTMRIIHRGDKYFHKLLNVTLKKKYFRKVDGWVRADPFVLESWRSASLTETITDQMLTHGGTYSHRRKLEKAEILTLRRELENCEHCFQNRREVVKMYDEILGDLGFSKIVVPANYTPAYIRYPILFFDRKRLQRCLKDLYRAGFVVDGRFRPLHKSPLFSWANRNQIFTESVYVSEHILPLPLGPDFDSEKVEKIASIVRLSLAR